jgi:hypothetical protein
VKRTYDMILDLPLPIKRMSTVFSGLRNSAQQHLENMRSHLGE